MIAIYEDTGGDLSPDDYRPTALYDGDEWLAGGDQWADYYPPGTPEDALTNQLDGPSTVAVEVDDANAVLAAIEKSTEGSDDGGFDL